MRKRFGELLLEQGLITQPQLGDALSYQRRNGMRLGDALVARGHITEVQLVNALGAALRVPVVRLEGLEPNPQALQLVGLQLCSEHDLFPYSLRTERGRKILTVATSDPLNFRLLDELEFMTNSKIEAVLARRTDIDIAIRKHYGPRLARPYQTEDVRLALEASDSAEMTIYRRGGGEEKVNTQTGPLPTMPDARLQNAKVDLPPEARRPPTEDVDISAVLLTEEVVEEEETAEAPIPLTARKPPSGTYPAAARPTPVTGTHAPLAPSSSTDLPAVPRSATHAAPPVAPSTFSSVPTQAPSAESQVPSAPLTSAGVAGASFDDALGQLIDAASEQDHAEAILRLERKFWALMRVLAKKGLLTNEDFLEELGEEERWRK